MLDLLFHRRVRVQHCHDQLTLVRGRQVQVKEICIRQTSSAHLRLHVHATLRNYNKASLPDAVHSS